MNYLTHLISHFALFSAEEAQLKKAQSHGRGQQRGAPEIVAPVADEQEEKVLAEVMRQSKREHESDSRQRRKDEQMLTETLEVSKMEAAAIQEQRRDIEHGLSRLALIDEPKKRAASASGQRRAVPPPPSYDRPPPAAGGHRALPGIAPKGKSSSDAASDWLAQAQAEAAGAGAASHGSSGSSQDAALMKERAEFLKQQRDKLLAMKKEAREKQLAKAEGSSNRPRSARVARSAMDDDPALLASREEEAKKIEMRKAIAEKLRQEVINN